MNNERMIRLLQVIRDLSASLEFESFLQSIVDAACELTNSKSASILRYDSSADVLSFVAAPLSQRKFLREVYVPLEGRGWLDIPPCRAFGGAGHND
jgi:GAF domain-containing protein